MGIKQFLKDVGSNVLAFLDAVAEVHEKKMNTPTSCKLCKEEYLYKYLQASDFYTLQNTREQYPHDRTWLKHGYRGYCPTCWETVLQECKKEHRIIEYYPREMRRVQYHNKRAQELGLEGTLTITEWMKTLEHHKWQCAYRCGNPYEELEHHIPLRHGGGTTAENCVPSCQSCNRTKGALHPDEIMTKGSSRSPESHRQLVETMKLLHGKSPTEKIEGAQ